MKPILLSILLVSLLPITGGSQQSSRSAYAGVYYGVMLPTNPRCSEERMALQVLIFDDGTMDFTVERWDDSIFLADSFIGWVRPGKWSIQNPSEWSLTFTCSPASGTIRGHLNARKVGECVRTFTAYRQFRR